MNNIFFFQTQQISDDSSLFDQFKKQKIYFSYFQVDRNYYLFFYTQQSIDIDFLYQSIDVIQELDSKQRKIRSLRGFFLYALEIMEKGEDYEILATNLQPFFWRKVKNVIRQNKKEALQEFLFGSNHSIEQDNKSTGEGSISPLDEIDERIENLQNQVNSLQEKVMNLEIQLKNSKYALSATLEAPDAGERSQQGDYTLKPNKGLYELENNPNLQQGEEPRNEISESVSEPSKMRSNESFQSQPAVSYTSTERSEEYNIFSNQNEAQNRANFITLSKIPEEEQIEIIQTGFQRQAEGRISLKKYYEGATQYSLLQLKGYSIKYETIRRTKLYQKLKP